MKLSNETPEKQMNKSLYFFLTTTEHLGTWALGPLVTYLGPWAHLFGPLTHLFVPWALAMF
jgi:hypothetical protein